MYALAFAKICDQALSLSGLNRNIHDLNSKYEAEYFSSNVDLSVDESADIKTPYILNSKPCRDDIPGTILYPTVVDKHLISMSLHGFNYLTPKWRLDIIDNRVLNESQ